MFYNIANLNTAEVATQLGGDMGVGSVPGGAAADFYPRYVLLDAATMARVEQCYEAEHLIATANAIKSDHNLGVGGFEVSFAGKTVLDDERYHHLEAVNALLEHARRYKDMFGFVLLQDASARLESEVRDILGLPTFDEDDPDAELYTREHQNVTQSAINGATPIADVEQRLTEMASKYIFRASKSLGLPDVRRELLVNTRVLGEFAASVSAATNYRGPVTASNGPALPTPATIGGGVPQTPSLPSESAVANVDSERLQRSKTRASFDFLFTRLRYVKPVMWNDGRIYLRINSLQNERDLVFVRERADTKDMTVGDRAVEEKKALDEQRLPKTCLVDDTVRIYSWPGLLPRDDGTLRGPMVKVMHNLWAWMDADRRLVEADESNVRPTVWLTNTPTATGSTRDMTEQELLELGAKPTRADDHATRARIAGEMRMTAMINMANRRRQNEVTEAIAEGSLAPNGEDVDRKALYRLMLNNPRFDMRPLPFGWSVSTVASGKSLDDVESRKATYQESIAGMCGIPLIQLLGGMGNSQSASSGSATASTSAKGGGKAAVTGGSASLSGGVLRPIITKDRTDLAMFLEESLEILFRDMSNTELARVLKLSVRESEKVARGHDVLLATLQEHFHLLTDAARQLLQTAAKDSARIKTALISQYQQITDAAMKVSTMNHRFQLRFLKELFVDNAEIDMLVQIGARTDLEAANMKLAKMGLPPIDEQSFERNRKRRLEQNKEEVDSQQPTPQLDPNKVALDGGGGGGLPAAKKKK